MIYLGKFILRYRKKRLMGNGGYEMARQSLIPKSWPSYPRPQCEYPSGIIAVKTHFPTPFPIKTWEVLSSSDIVASVPSTMSL